MISYGLQGNFGKRRHLSDEKPRVHWIGVISSVLSQIRATLKIRAKAMK